MTFMADHWLEDEGDEGNEDDEGEEDEEDDVDCDDSDNSGSEHREEADPHFRSPSNDGSSGITIIFIKMYTH